MTSKTNAKVQLTTFIRITLQRTRGECWMGGDPGGGGAGPGAPLPHSGAVECLRVDQGDGRVSQELKIFRYVKYL